MLSLLAEASHVVFVQRKLPSTDFQQYVSAESQFKLSLYIITESNVIM